MKNHLLLLLFMSVSIMVVGQKKVKFYGMIKVQDKLWVDDTEITNTEYRQFIQSLPKHKKEHFYPDTTVWMPDETMCSYYFWHPAYDDYPVVGINYKQVQAFCKWRTNLYKKEFPDRNVTFRLPSKKEWEMIATPNFTADQLVKANKKKQQFIVKEVEDNSLSLDSLEDVNVLFAGGWESVYGVKLKKKKKHQFYFNFFQDDFGLVGIDGTLYTNQVHSYGTDAKKIYGLSGNVAEMVEGEGVSVGGSWAHNAEKCLIGNTLNYEKPAPWLGFRCVVEVTN